MKKLMIAAAAVAMVGGAYAALNETYTWNTNSLALADGVEMSVVTTYTTNTWTGVVTTNIAHNNYVELDQSQILSIKYKASSSKSFCLNDEKNEYDSTYKPSATISFKTPAKDEVWYFDEVWTKLSWSKNSQTAQFFAANAYGYWSWHNFSDVTKAEYEAYVATNKVFKNVSPTKFECYADKGGKKVWGALNVTRGAATTFTNRAGESVVVAYNAYGNVYGEVDTKNDIMTGLKSTVSTAYSLKTYKSDKELDKAIEAILKKFEKAGGLIKFAK